MKYTLFSYRHAEEIIRSTKFGVAFDEIADVILRMPLFVWRNKSKKNSALYAVQQISNAYFDRRLHCDLGWLYHPLATQIASSGLKADFQKAFGGGEQTLRVQAEVQFGNMSRWYSDIFKFQAAYSSNMIELGLSIVPMQSLANLIDSNVVNFERVKRELPSAQLSITLPILVFGIEPDTTTPVYDVRLTRFNNFKRDITGVAAAKNRFRIVNGYLSGKEEEDVGPESPTGPTPADR